MKLENCTRVQPKIYVLLMSVALQPSYILLFAILKIEVSAKILFMLKSEKQW